MDRDIVISLVWSQVTSTASVWTEACGADSIGFVLDIEAPLHDGSPWFQAACSRVLSCSVSSTDILSW